MSNKPIRHGECWLQPVDKFPKGKLIKHDMFIVGHSETGHHHVLEGDVQVLEPTNLEDGVFFELLGEGKLVHQKTVNRHHDLVVAPGKYRVIHKQEYSPFTKVMERVWD